MKTVACWDDLRPYGIVVLTGEACSFAYRILCDLTATGKRAVERCFSVQITSESWNSGSAADPHVGSIMLSRETFLPLAVFAMLESGCKEVWLAEHPAIAVEDDDSEVQVELMKKVAKPHRRFAFHGPNQDRNQHQMSGRVR